MRLMQTMEKEEWYLKYEKAVESILRLGDKDPNPCNASMPPHSLQDMRVLPCSLQVETYGIEEEGRDKLKQIIKMITDTRSTDKNNLGPKNNQAPRNRS